MKNIFIYRLARYSSNIFVPPTFTFLVFLLTSIFFSDGRFPKLFGIFQGLILGLILPILFFMFIKDKGIISDVDATIKEQRLFPYIFGALLSSIGIIVNYFYGYELLVIIWLIYFVIMLTLLIINKYWKISAHAIGVNIPFGILLYFFGGLALYFIPLILLVCWSRIYLKKHTLLQVAAGALLGLSVSYSIIWLV